MNISDNEFNALLEREYNDTYNYYREYFATLDFSGISRFMMGADDLLGSFVTSPESFGRDERLFRVRRRAIVMALMEQPTAEYMKEDILILAEIAGIVWPLRHDIVH